MGIVMSEGGTAATTNTKIEYFRWASIKQMVKLDKLGLKHSGGALRPRLAPQLKLKPRDSHEAYLEAIEARLVALRNEVAAIEEASKEI